MQATNPGPRDSAARHCDVITPEGVPLTFRLAPAGSRAAALLLDLLFVSLLLALLGATASVTDDATPQHTTAILAIAAFAVINFYFVFYELRGQGQTPGKRLMGIRVIDRRGGPLTPRMVFVRNVTRELELWTPLRVLLTSETLGRQSPGWVRGVTLCWLAGIAMWPLFNRLRQRPGDLLADSLVVEAPTAALQPDVAERITDASDAFVLKPTAGTVQSSDTHHAAVFTFSTRELSVYGETELVVLETLLREFPSTKRTQAVAAVATAIAQKIQRAEVSATERERFIYDFYVAQRARLERARLLGKTKIDKYS